MLKYHKDFCQGLVENAARQDVHAPCYPTICCNAIGRGVRIWHDGIALEEALVQYHVSEKLPGLVLKDALFAIASCAACPS